MNTWDIPININVNAETEELAEAIVENLFRFEMTKPALERAVNSWDFIQFVSEDEPDSEFFMGS